MKTRQLDPSDVSAIDALMDAWTEANDHGDARAISALYAVDADLVLINGHRVAGRDGIEAMYQMAFEQLPGNKARIVRESRRLLADDIVVDDGTWEVVGGLPDGAPSNGRSTTVFQKHEGQWLIQCVRIMVPVVQTALD
jgi:uncharacterized protein (TIGR02246 family)